MLARAHARLLLLRGEDLFVVVKLIQELARGFGRRRLVAEPLGHPEVLAQHGEIVEALAAYGVEHQETFDVGGFIEPAATLLERQVALDARRDTEAAGGPHKQRQAAEGSERFFERRLVDFKQELALGRAAQLLVETHA